MSENATNEKNCRHGIDRSVVLCTDCDAAEGRFLERAELTKQINELPEMLRQYVHDLEADADPAGDKMRIVCLEENMAGLTDEIDRQRAEIERLTRERDEARKPPHCINCHCEESAKGMVDLSDYLDLHRGLMAVVYESKSHAEAVLFSERALRHAESEHVISEAASSAVASDPYADQNRALVAEIAARRGITLGHLREDGGCELAQIMRRLDAAEAEVERLRAELKAATESEYAFCVERDQLRAEVGKLRAAVCVLCERDGGVCAMGTHEADDDPCTPENCSTMRAVRLAAAEREALERAPAAEDGAP